jgi:hypothetical protein
MEISLVHLFFHTNWYPEIQEARKRKRHLLTLRGINGETVISDHIDVQLRLIISSWSDGRRPILMLLEWRPPIPILNSIR